MNLPEIPPRTPKHTEEQLKLGATLLQNFALTLSAAALLAPLLNPALSVPLWAHLLAMPFAGLAEILAFTLLRYIPPPPQP